MPSRFLLTPIFSAGRSQAERMASYFRYFPSSSHS